MGVAQAFQLLRARISMFAQGRDGGEGVWMRFDPGDPSALRVLASSAEDARRKVSVLRGSPQPWLTAGSTRCAPAATDLAS